MTTGSGSGRASWAGCGSRSRNKDSELLFFAAVVTPSEYLERLEAMSDEEYADFVRAFGGDLVSKQDQVKLLVQSPELYERGIAHILGLSAEAEKRTKASVDSAAAAKAAAFAVYLTCRQAGHSRQYSVHRPLRKWVAVIAALIALAALVVALL